MKTLYLSIITGLGIAVVIFIIFQFASLYPLVDTPGHNNWKINQATPDIIEQNTQQIIIQNQTYFFEALDDTTTAYHNDPVQISFHNVVFTLFPHPFSGGPPGSCGGTGFGADAKFPDGIHELLGIFIQNMPCLGDSTPTNLSNHTNPQAGLVFYHGKIRLLVSTEDKSHQNVSTVIIPNDSESVSSGKNYEPRYLVVVLGTNNTVRWVNQGEVMNFIAADNQNDPNFFDATSKQTYLNVQEDNNVNPPNFLGPGESFEYTFTKSGYFGYHGTHQWQHGWVLVLPQSATSATTTVTLNDSNVLGPCQVFALPCPQGPHIFTAQQFGSNIYVEKITINGFDNYAVIKPEGFCVYTSIRTSHSCTSPDDLAILRLSGVDLLAPQQFATLNDTSSGTIPVAFNNGVNSGFSINYTITGGKLLGAIVNLESQSLTISLTTSSNGNLIVNVPRGLLDFRHNDYWMNGNIDVYVDGAQVDYTVKKSEGNWVVTLALEREIKKIEIIPSVSGVLEEEEK